MPARIYAPVPLKVFLVVLLLVVAHEWQASTSDGMVGGFGSWSAPATLEVPENIVERSLRR